jgi:hypothetical protein
LDVIGNINSSTNITADGNVTCSELHCDTIVIPTLDITDAVFTNLTTGNILINGTMPTISTVGIYGGKYTQQHQIKHY